MDAELLRHLGFESTAMLAYSFVGILLMALGFLMVDLLTPGSLRKQIWEERNRNSALLLASNLIAVAMVAAMSIFVTTYDTVWVGVASSFIYGVLSLAIMGVAFLLLDLMTPGRLGELVTCKDKHPAVYVSAAMHLAVALIIVAGLT